MLLSLQEYNKTKSYMIQNLASAQRISNFCKIRSLSEDGHYRIIGFTLTTVSDI
jgi:hypothetical protein